MTLEFMTRSPNKKEHDIHFKEDGGNSARYSRTEIEFGDGKKGFIEIEMCVKCGYIETARCLHEKNSWTADGKILLCDLCGADGT